MTDSVREGMAMDDFIAAMNQQPFELIRGERIEKVPNAARHIVFIRLVRRLIEAFVDKLNLGYVFSEATYILPDSYDANWVKGSRIPDISFYAKVRLDEYIKADPDWGDKPFALVPDIAVEIVSPNDRYTEIGIKVDAYRKDGVRLVWIIDPQQEKVTVHRLAEEHPIVLTKEKTLSGEDVLPGFEVKISEIFAG